MAVFNQIINAFACVLWFRKRRGWLLARVDVLDRMLFNLWNWISIPRNESVFHPSTTEPIAEETQQSNANVTHFHAQVSVFCCWNFCSSDWYMSYGRWGRIENKQNVLSRAHFIFESIYTSAVCGCLLFLQWAMYEAYMLLWQLKKLMSNG